ncbi:hypothetical protein BDL97_03G115600, partial [Sphagnum fallax]
DLQGDEIKFNIPYDYLQQIEGFIGTAHGWEMESGEKLVCVTSLTFKSNIKTYGSYGNPEGGTHFKSGIGKIVGFCGRSCWGLDQIGAFITNIH